MPHVILSGQADLARAWQEFPEGPFRFGNAVARIEGRFLSASRRELLLEAVVVEFGRPLHPVILVSLRQEGTGVHLWDVVRVERTEAVKALIALVGRELARFGAGEVRSTNLKPELLSALGVGQISAG
ncbi:MAG: hypothetical protein ACOY7U_09635 [Acidobacteriota bacterium]|uniref:Uncharacterized protein n=1 Tax=Thermoanaerobaculum aquaticum TaxID=1312852 RepID=A0A062XR74_9BACT|nr:hypothetical protein [Thermoanaerobaculum aquaticum]KDA53313.1 hypothetical protein EG19_06070 [Thermoanaerobaculum aquaticum]BCW92671.1 MAG: hypothetical protein KatS3mg007_0565 [Thermoanaerobaculum sp.]GBC79662.1 hypothetical protein HRbin09_00886 [bacterium HR09]